MERWLGCGYGAYVCARMLGRSLVNGFRADATQRPTNEDPRRVGFPPERTRREYDRDQQPVEQACAGSTLGTVRTDRYVRRSRRNIESATDLTGSFRIEAFDRRVLEFDEGYHFVVKGHERLFLRIYIAGTVRRSICRRIRT